jgi:hypothetical protein
MRSKEELLKLKKDAEEVLSALPQEFQQAAQQQYDNILDELAEVERREQEAMAQSTPPPTQPTPIPAQAVTPMPQPTPTPSGTELDIDKALATILTMMQSSPAGSGMDDQRVRDMIEVALANSVIKIEQLDKRVLDEIKKNQLIELKLPNFGEPILVTKDDTDIPYFFEMLDDIQAGNNIYLIGEAGAGKTYGAKAIAKKLKRELLTINCSQYTSPTEIVGGQTIDGYKSGKLIDAWKDGKMLILDEMPRLDANTAGLFNDALAQSSKTTPSDSAIIYSTNPTDPPFKRSPKFALIATGNVYPNTPPPPKYKANNQQDLSLLDRFSGSVYFVGYSRILDEKQCRYKFLYDMIIGNYYEYTEAIKNNASKPTPTGLRTIILDLNLEDLAVVSYRTIVAFRVAFEFELVRELQRRKNPDANIQTIGKTLYKAFESFLVAFNDTSKNDVIRTTGFTKSFVENRVNEAINKIANNKIVETLVDVLKGSASDILKTYDDLYVPDIKN